MLRISGTLVLITELVKTKAIILSTALLDEKHILIDTVEKQYVLYCNGMNVQSTSLWQGVPGPDGVSRNPVMQAGFVKEGHFVSVDFVTDQGYFRARFEGKKASSPQMMALNGKTIRVEPKDIRETNLIKATQD